MCGYISAVLFLLSCYVAISISSQKDSIYRALGGSWLIVCFVGSALLIHIFTYLNEINDDDLCTVYVDGFSDAFTWSEAGEFIHSVTSSFEKNQQNIY